MQHISVEQIKAARGLLSITQAELAAKVGISKPAMNNIERMLSNPRPKTIARIQYVLEQLGVAFTEGPGVKRVTDIFSTQTFEGTESFFQLQRDIMETLLDGGYLLISGVDDSLYEEFGRKRFETICKKRYDMGIRSRVLIKEGDTRFIDPIDHYRHIPSEIFNQVPYYVYGNKYALHVWEPVHRIVIIENAAIAESYRRLFYTHWKRGKIPKQP